MQDYTKTPTASALNSFGNLSSPLLDIPLKNSLAITKGVGATTFTRTTTATYIDRYGVLKTAAIDEPRFEKEGLLVEGTSTNLLTYSEDFSNAAWAKTSGLSVLLNNTISPDGSTTAEKVYENTSTSTPFYTAQAIAQASNTYATFSVYVKASERSAVRLQLYNSIVTSDIILCNFDLSTGTIYSYQANGTATLAQGSIQYVNDGWYRLSVSGIPSTSSENIKALVALLSSPGGGATYNGVVNSGLYIWGAQLEALPFSTSYIPTTTTAVTRGADEASISFANNIPSLSDDVTISAIFDKLGQMPTYQTVFETSESFRMIRTIDTGLLQSYIGSSSVNVYPHPLTSSKVSVVYSSGVTKMYRNGLLVGTATTGVPTGSSNYIYIGVDSTGTSNLYGHISEFKIYDKALSAFEASLL